MKKIAILLSGRGSNFISIHNSIKSGNISGAEISLVLSNKADALGLTHARAEGLHAVFADYSKFKDRVKYDMYVAAQIKDSGADLICLAGYMRIVSKEFVEIFKDRLINIHPSILPSFPGLDAQQQAFDYGVKYSGCTVHFVDEKVDHGAIILQSLVAINDDDTVDDISARILKEEHLVYSKAVKLFVEDKIRIIGRKVVVQK